MPTVTAAPPKLPVLRNLPANWSVVPFDPDVDEPPADLDLDCLYEPGRRSASASSRGWGAPCSGTVITIARADGVRLPVRRDLAQLIAILCDESERLGFNLVPGWCWGYACRHIRNSRSWSNHAWALAVDLNAPENPRGPRRGKIRRYPKVIALWKRFGFGWGGDYSGTADDMHMEFNGTPADAKRLTAAALRKFKGAKPPPKPAPTKPIPKPKPGAAPAWNKSWAPFEYIPRRLMRSAQIKTWQTQMRNRGWKISVDGVFGPNSRMIAFAFQRDKRLPQDGIVGPVTWRAAWNAPISGAYTEPALKPPAKPSTTKLTDVQVAKLAHSVGFRGKNLEIALAIEMGEGDGNPTILSRVDKKTPKWGISIGLWQVRPLNAEYGKGTSRDAKALRDPKHNARSAMTIYRERGNFTAWGAFNDGKYKRHLARARKAIAAAKLSG